MARSHFKKNVGYIPFLVGYKQISKKHVGYIQIPKKNSSAIYHFGRLYTTLGRLWLNIETMSAIYHCKSAIYHSENLGRLNTIFGRPFAANFVSTRCLFWGLFTCCELSFYTRCLFWGLFTWCLFLHDIYFEVCLHVVNFLSIHDVYFEVCLHVMNFVSTRYLFWGLFTCCELSFYTWCLFLGVFTCCELCPYTISILKIVYMLWTLFVHDVYFS